MAIKGRNLINTNRNNIRYARIINIRYKLKSGKYLQIPSLPLTADFFQKLFAGVRTRDLLLHWPVTLPLCYRPTAVIMYIMYTSIPWITTIYTVCLGVTSNLYKRQGTMAAPSTSSWLGRSQTQNRFAFTKHARETTENSDLRHFQSAPLYKFRIRQTGLIPRGLLIQFRRPVLWIMHNGQTGPVDCHLRWECIVPLCAHNPHYCCWLIHHLSLIHIWRCRRRG